MKAGTVYWVTGLSGAGKTTIGKLFYERLCEKKENVIFLDGDTLREVFGNDLGYEREDRFRCAMRYARLCRLLSSQGHDIVICTISMFHDVRSWNRDNIERYREIFIKTSMETLRERNQKDLYQSGNNVVGLDLELELPDNPDVAISNDGDLLPQEALDYIWDKLCLEKGDGYD